MTATTGVPRTPCEDIVEKTTGALPHRFTNVSEENCVYGYYYNRRCMYDSFYDYDPASNDGPCYDKDFGADHVAGRCYYNGESTCHCSATYRRDENLCYNFAIDMTRFATDCSHGLITGSYCLYEQRIHSATDSKCPSDDLGKWDLVGDGFCYKREHKKCDKFQDDGFGRKTCLKSSSVVSKAVSN